MKRFLIPALATLAFIVSFCPSAYAQNFELSCPAGSSPIFPIGQSYNPSTNKFRQWLCIDNNGTVTFQVNGTNAAIKPAASDAVQYVSANGNDSNDGFSWGSAKATIQAALTVLQTPNGGEIFLGAGTFTTNSEIVIPNRVSLIGNARANATGGQGTLIKAGATFPSSTPVITLGNGTPIFGARVENLTVSCNDITGSIGISNVSGQEQSGVDHVLVDNCLADDFLWSGSGAQNSFIHDAEALADSSVGAAWLGVIVSGTSGFRGIDGLTVNGSGAGTEPTDCMSIADAALYQNIHVENCVTGILLSGSGETLSNILGGPTVTNVIELSSGTQEFFGTSLVLGSATNLVKNDANSAFNSSASAISVYAVGNGATPPVLFTNTGGTFTLNSLSFSSSGGGTVTHQPPNTASAVVVTDPIATTPTPVAGSCAMAAGTTCTITVVSGASKCIATDQGGTIAGQCAISGTTLTVTAASSNSSTWAVLWW